MEDLWLQTRKRSEAEIRLLAELKRLREEAQRGLRSAELRLAYARTRVHFPELRIPSRVALMFRHVNVSFAQRVTCSRADLDRFLVQDQKRWQRGQLFLIHPLRVAAHLIRDGQLFLVFALALLRGGPELTRQTPDASS